MTMLQKALSEAGLMRHKGMWVSQKEYFTFFALVQGALHCSYCFFVLLKPFSPFFSLSSTTNAPLKTKFRLNKGQTCQKESAEPKFCSLNGDMMHLVCAGSYVKIQFAMFFLQCFMKTCVCSWAPPFFLPEHLRFECLILKKPQNQFMKHRLSLIRLKKIHWANNWFENAQEPATHF